MEAFKLGEGGIEVPDEVIVYDDADVAFDPEFDAYEWQRTDMDPFKERLTVHIEMEKSEGVDSKNGIELDHLLEKLIHDFYSSSNDKRKVTHPDLVKVSAVLAAIGHKTVW
ncbi:MAG: hypothetical protein IPK21_03180 [Haliscomenobacter sp.]|nr:hypothetical protein [Haliscomenobacter sp.]